VDSIKGRWTGLSDTAVVATVGHGWTLVAGLLAICLVANLAAFFLIPRIQKERGYYRIRLPFLSITREPREKS
jgi:hypothetical protein